MAYYDITNGDVLGVQESKSIKKEKHKMLQLIPITYVVGTEIKSDGTETTVFVRKFDSI